MFPLINKQPLRTVSIPTINGGINMRDAVTNVADNQLIGGSNIWFNDGMLCTRSGVVNAGSDYLFADNLNSGAVYGKTTVHNDIVKTQNGLTYKLASSYVSQDKNMTLSINWISEEQDGSLNVEKVDSRVFNPPEFSGTAVLTNSKYNYFIVLHEDKLYLYLMSSGTYANASTKETVESFEVYSCNINDGTGLIKLTDEDYYIPTVLINGDYDADRDGVDINGDKISGILMQNGASMIEGHSLLSPYYKMLYTSIPESKRGLGDYSRKAIYHTFNLPLDRVNKGKKIKLQYTNNSGNSFSHEITVENSAEEIESTAGDDGYRLKVSNAHVSLIDADNNVVVFHGTDCAGPNNVEIIVPWVDNNEAKKLFNMSRAEWFGGASEGLNGGTRLFLGGYTGNKSEYKSLVIWSGLNNPLYFSEGSYFHVGDSSTAVTAFGKQGSSLVIFKENEIYYTEYNQNTDFTGEDITAQRVIDTEVSSVTFPLIQIHNSIGCDCPDTVQLCRNRLVWAASSGQVYQLYTSSQYNERNVYAVGEMVERALKTEDLKKAVSVDWDGWYCLSCPGGKMYLMEYNSYGYQYPNSFLKEESTNVRIPWYIWDLQVSTNSADGIKHPTSINNKLCFIETVIAENKAYICLHTYQNDRDYDDVYINGEYVKKPIQSRIETKVFDFGSPAYQKKVPLVNISFGGNGGTPIKVVFISENGTIGSEVVKLTESVGGAYTAGYSRNRIFRPVTLPINRFGIVITCEGKLIINAISLNYRLLGGSR